MNCFSLAPPILTLLLLSMTIQAQSIARVNQLSNNPALNQACTKAIVALKRLQNDVIVYRSLAEFEGSGKLARVSLETFERDLREVTSEVQPTLRQMPASRIKTAISNALDSYRDGVFWWRQIEEPRVIHVSKLSAALTTTQSDIAFRANVPYTVAIHWRQAQKYLSQAETRSSDNDR